MYKKFKISQIYSNDVMAVMRCLVTVAHEDDLCKLSAKMHLFQTHHFPPTSRQGLQARDPI